MKKIIALVFAALMTAACLCACEGMENTMNKAKDKASEVVSDLNDDATKYSGDNNGLFDDNRETITPTNASDNLAETETAADVTDDDTMGENIGEMIENGEVEDGDGNVGSLENSDSDANTDENAAEYAQDQIVDNTQDYTNAQ